MVVFLSQLKQLQKLSDDEHSESEIHYPDELEFQEENEVVAFRILRVTELMQNRSLETAKKKLKLS